MSLEAFQLNGKNALVTGSHRGLGAAIAVALAKAGANVGCHGRDPKPGPSCAEILAAGPQDFLFFRRDWRIRRYTPVLSKKQSRSLVPSTFL